MEKGSERRKGKERRTGVTIHIVQLIRFNTIPGCGSGGEEKRREEKERDQ